MSNELINLMNKVNPTQTLQKTKTNTDLICQRNTNCPECKSHQQIIHNGELICGKCGLVLEGPSLYVDDTKITYPNGLNLFVED